MSHKVATNSEAPRRGEKKLFWRIATRGRRGAARAFWAGENRNIRSIL